MVVEPINDCGDQRVILSLLDKKKSSNPFDIKRLELLNEAGDENRTRDGSLGSFCVSSKALESLLYQHFRNTNTN